LARRLAGFGLNVKAIGRDFLAAVVNLVSIWPLMTLVIMMTILFGGYIWGPKYTIEPHEELKMISAYPQLSVRVLIGITTVIIVPAFEEMLFRGMFQTMIRSFLAKPWLSIAIASGLFAAVHSNAGHWPGLFVLSMCMGYAYEKSGSLLRPIFIHSLFNASSIIATLAQ
jgi:membrane protease YdiL (CAAX protease family)